LTRTSPFEPLLQHRAAPCTEYFQRRNLDSTCGESVRHRDRSGLRIHGRVGEGPCSAAAVLCGAAVAATFVKGRAIVGP
jgi:hypothetical protein